MYKLFRYYELAIQTKSGESIILNNPFTLEFDISRHDYSSANTGSFRLYNLSKTNREQIRFNKFEGGDVNRQVILKAGYGLTNLSTIFTGTIISASSMRQGVDWITSINANDGGLALSTGQIPPGLSFPKGTPNKVVLQQLILTLSNYGVTPGFIGDFPGVSARAKVYDGNIISKLQELSGGSFFIDGQVAHCIKYNEGIIGPIALIDASSGLLGSPILEENNLNFDMIFEPRLVVGQLINLVSTTNTNVTGQKKVTSVKHRGTISDAVCGDAITSVGMVYYGNLKPVVTF